MDGWTGVWMDDGWMSRCFCRQIASIKNCSELQIGRSSPNVDIQTESPNTSQYSKTVAVRGLHRQATVGRERELHAEPELLLVKWAGGAPNSR